MGNKARVLISCLLAGALLLAFETFALSGHTGPLGYLYSSFFKKNHNKHLIVKVEKGEEVRLKNPQGKTLSKLDDKTQFGSPQTFHVVDKQGDKAKVISESLPNNKKALVELDPEKLDIRKTPYSLVADLSERKLRLKKGTHNIKTIKVTIGSRKSPTPTGRFQVTDKLAGSRYSQGYYGCCILALSGKQTKIPNGWRGGNRLAIHGTSDPADLGKPASAGCLRANDPDLKSLMKKVPLGAPVIIQK